MTTIRRIFRHATRLAVRRGRPAGRIIAAPAAFATEVPPPGAGDTGPSAVPATVHTVTVGGTPGWQIALFIVAAAALAAAVAVLRTGCGPGAAASWPRVPTDPPAGRA